MVLILAQIEAPRLPREHQTSVEAPTKPGKIIGSPAIASPGFGGARSGKHETSGEREKRLQNAGVLEVPVPKDNRPKVLSEFEKLSHSAAATTNSISGTERRFVFQVGSWWEVVKPQNTIYRPDLSYGFSYLQAIDSKPFEIGKWTSQKYIGLGIKSFNGETTVEYSIDGSEVSTTAKTNATEFGFDFSRLRQKTYMSGHGWGAEYVFRYYPIKFLKSQYTSIQLPPATSEVKQRFIINYLGIGSTVSFYYTFAQFFKMSVFADLHLSTPFQMRAQAGLSFELAEQKEK